LTTNSEMYDVTYLIFKYVMNKEVTIITIYSFIP